MPLRDRIPTVAVSASVNWGREYAGMLFEIKILALGLEPDLAAKTVPLGGTARTVLCVTYGS